MRYTEAFPKSTEIPLPHLVDKLSKTDEVEIFRYRRRSVTTTRVAVVITTSTWIGYWRRDPQGRVVEGSTDLVDYVRASAGWRPYEWRPVVFAFTGAFGERVLLHTTTNMLDETKLRQTA